MSVSAVANLLCFLKIVKAIQYIIKNIVVMFVEQLKTEANKLNYKKFKSCERCGKQFD